MQLTHRVFISATSADLGSYRKVVKSALVTNGVLPVEQDDFPPDWRSVQALLDQKIGACDAVICLVGYVFGAEPPDASRDQLRRSYTQLEYDTARRLGKKVFLFLATPDCAFDGRPPEDPERVQLQLAHIAAIRGGGARWEEFSSPAQLHQRVAHIQFAAQSPGLGVRQNLPYVSLGSLFKGREDLMEGLRGKLLSARTSPDPIEPSALTHREVLCGLGGVGKTRLAVEYAWKHQRDYTAALFVVADGEEALKRNLASLSGARVLNLPDVQQGPEDDRIAAVIRWLADHPCWCLILDNVDTREAAAAVEALLAQLSGGHVIITSRLAETEWSRDVEPLQLDVLAPAAARDFLLDRTERRRRTPDDDADAERLVCDLGGLALGLEQAGAFIERQRCSLADYLARWNAGETRVREWFDERLMHYPRSLAITWDTTMREIGPAARALLRVLAWFAPSPVPEALLRTPEAGELLARAMERSGDAPGAGEAVHPDDALVELAAFSLVRRSDDQGEPCFSLHCLVEEITRKQILEPPGRRALLRAAVSLFVAYAPRDADRFERWATWRLLIPHAESLWACSEKAPREDWNDRLLDVMALYYMGQDDSRDVPLQRLSVDLKKERLPAGDPALPLALNDLALMLPNSSAEEKERLYREALDGRIRVHGEKSEEVGETLHNYGVFLGAMQRWEEAVPLMRRAQAVFEGSVGLHHWRTLMADMSLAIIRAEQGAVSEAIEMLRRNVEDKKRHLSPAHHDTLSAIRTLATFLESKQEWADAEALRREYLQGAAEAYGRCHDLTLDGHTRLAANLASQGRVEEAVEACRGLLLLCEGSLGPEHERTLQSSTSLIQVLDQLGRTEEAGQVRREFAERLMHARNVPPLMLRALALDCYRSGCHELAERLLSRVLERNFEIAGTLCHLARLALITNRPALAREHLARAWSRRTDAPAYVVPRILWLQLAAGLAVASSDRAGSPDVPLLLGRIKTALVADGVHCEWTMDPVLNRLQSQVTAGELELLAALVAALSFPERLAALEGFAAWREAEPRPLV